MSEATFNALMRVLDYHPALRGHTLGPSPLRWFIVHYGHLFASGPCVARHRHLLLALDTEEFVSVEDYLPTPIDLAPKHWAVEYYQFFGPKPEGAESQFGCARHSASVSRSRLAHGGAVTLKARLLTAPNPGRCALIPSPARPGRMMGRRQNLSSRPADRCVRQ